MRRFLSLLVIVFCVQAQAQTDEKAEILKVVNQVFEAMRTSDSTLLKEAFVEKPATYTIFNTKTSETRFIVDDFRNFINAVGKPKEDVWNEPIWAEKVEIDGPMASVWVEYAFYVNDKFSHCGVDAFQLVKLDGKWKIFHLADTRRRASCVVPEDVQREYGKME